MFKNTSIALVGGSALALLLSSTSVSAQETLAHWNFDAGIAGTPLSERPSEDISGNGFLLYGYDATVGPAYSPDTAAASGLSCRTAGQQDGYTTDPRLNGWSPAAWTIEVSARLNELGGWSTIIGRDGSSWPGIPKSDFYLQKNGVDDRLRLDFATADGSRYQLESGSPVAAGTWYNIAAVSDGRTVSLYIDSNNGQGYQLADSIALTGTNHALATNGANWTFGRGWYAEKMVDHIDGLIDDVRFTDGALPPSRFLHASAPAAPAIQVAATVPAPNPQKPEAVDAPAAPATPAAPVVTTPAATAPAPAATPAPDSVRRWKGPRHQGRTF